MKIDLSHPRSPERLSYSRAAISTAISVVVTWIVTALALVLTPYNEYVFNYVIGPTLIIATVVPITVSFPVSLILQRGRLKLARALRELEAVHGELERRARIDPLTGLLNRETLLKEIEEHRAKGVRGAILMVDIDHFKSINDQYGHQAGDEALKCIADALATSVCENDLVGRLGGEEFGVFVPCERLDRACEIAERARKAVALLHFEPIPGVHRRITTSIGIAMGERTVKLSEIMRHADESLYDAKESGRNRVVVHDAA